MELKEFRALRYIPFGGGGVSRIKLLLLWQLIENIRLQKQLDKSYKFNGLLRDFF